MYELMIQKEGWQTHVLRNICQRDPPPMDAKSSFHESTKLRERQDSKKQEQTIVNIGPERGDRPRELDRHSELDCADLLG